MMHEIQNARAGRNIKAGKADESKPVSDIVEHLSHTFDKTFKYFSDIFINITR